MRVTIFTGILVLLGALALPLVATADGPPADGPPGAGPSEGGPPPGDRPRFSPERLFERFDEDGDGALSEDEAPERLKARFDEVDDDGDGLVTLEEFKAHRPPRPQGPPPEDSTDGPGGPPAGPPPFAPDPERMMQHMLDWADADDDGQISREEALAKAGERFDRLDTNKDGVIDEAEMQEAVDKMVERMQERRDQRREQAGDRPHGPHRHGHDHEGPPPERD